MPSFTQLSRQMDAALNQFKALDLGKTEKERYGECSLPPYDPNQKSYPTLYLDGDELADLPESGEAVMKYQVVRRSTEERKGKKRHSLTIEVRSIDPKASAKVQEKKKAEGRAVAIATMSNAEGRMTNFGRGDQMIKLVKRLGPMGNKPDPLTKSVMRRGRLADQNYTKKGIQVVRDSIARNVKGLRKMRQFSAFARPRDGDGQFVGNVTGGADPVTMRQAYGQDPKKSNLLAPGAAAAALGGAAVGLGTKAGRGLVLKGAKGAARAVRSTVTGIQRKSQGRSTERYPVMGSRAPKKAVAKPGLGEVLIRQRMRGD